MKHTQRLDESRLGEALRERGLVGADALRDAQAAPSLSQALVGCGAIGDWDLSRVVCELFHLPFLPVDLAHPDRELWKDIPRDALLKHGLVPLCKHGEILTVAMPGLVGAEALSDVGEDTGLRVMPVVGTVQTNRRWIEANQEGESSEHSESETPEWGALFDEADAAVLMDLEQEGEPQPIRPAPRDSQKQTLAEPTEFDPATELPPAPEFS